MKTIKKTILLLFILVSTASAQFELNTSVGYGVEFKKNSDLNLFQSSINVDLLYRIDKFEVISETINMYSDSSNSFYSGIKFGYGFWNQKNKSLSVSVHGLIGTEGKKILGLGLNYYVDNLQLSYDLSQEYKSKSLIGILSVGYTLKL